LSFGQPAVQPFNTRAREAGKAEYGWFQNMTACADDPFESQWWQKGAFLLN